MVEPGMSLEQLEAEINRIESALDQESSEIVPTGNESQDADRLRMDADLQNFHKAREQAIQNRPDLQDKQIAMRFNPERGGTKLAGAKVELKQSATVAEAKQAVGAKFGFDPASLRFYRTGKEIFTDDSKPLYAAQVKHGNVIRVVVP